MRNLTSLLILMLACSSCTLRVDTRTDKEIEQQETNDASERRLKVCVRFCQPYKVLGFGHSCFCGVDK